MNRWRVTILAALVTVAATVLFGPARAQAAWPAPGTPAGVSYSTTAIALSWSPVWGAPRYLVKYSTSKSWTSPRYLRSTRPDAELAGLKPGTRYFVKVAVTTTSGAKLSGYGRSAEVSTGGSGSGYVMLAPGGLELRSRDADSVTLGWRGRSGAARYQIQYANNSRLSRAHFVGTTATTVKITGLMKSTNYWFRIRTKSSKGVATSTFSPARQLRTTSGEAFAPLRAATYNVMCANCSSSHPWAKRRAGLVKAIKAQDLDVLGVQEASQGLTVGADGTSKAQFDDLLDLLGKGYALTNTYRYNCARSTSPNNCDPTDRGASNDVRIIYNVHRVDRLGQGSVRFKAQDPGSPSRFLAWARLRQVSTGKKFFVVNTHLDPERRRLTIHLPLQPARRPDQGTTGGGEEEQPGEAAGPDSGRLQVQQVRNPEQRAV